MALKLAAVSCPCSSCRCLCHRYPVAHYMICRFATFRAKSVFDIVHVAHFLEVLKSFFLGSNKYFLLVAAQVVTIYNYFGFAVLSEIFLLLLKVSLYEVFSKTTKWVSESGFRTLLCKTINCTLCLILIVVTLKREDQAFFLIGVTYALNLFCF